MTDPRQGDEVVTVRISSTTGRVTVTARPDAAVSCTGSAKVVERAGDTTIEAGSGRLDVTVPEGANVLVGTRTGRVDVRGRVGHAAVVTETARVTLDRAASADVRSRSGKVEIGEVDGECRVRSASGRVAVRACGTTDVATKSGRVTVEEVDGPARVHCVSGRISIGMASANDVDAESVSGRIEVSVPPGVRVHRSDHPDDGSTRPADCDCTVAARSLTGRVAVTSR
jgi:DUF4097 and DUF4098 domain-containing protein YvlB